MLDEAQTVDLGVTLLGEIERLRINGVLKKVEKIERGAANKRVVTTNHRREYGRKVYHHCLKN